MKAEEVKKQFIKHKEIKKEHIKTSISQYIRVSETLKPQIFKQSNKGRNYLQITSRNIFYLMIMDYIKDQVILFDKQTIFKLIAEVLTEEYNFQVVYKKWLRHRLIIKWPMSNEEVTIWNI